MYFHEIVGHEVIFGDEQQDSVELLTDIPSKYVIGIISTLSNTLERKENNSRTQFDMLDAFSVNFPPDLRNVIFQKLAAYEQRRGSFSIFENRYLVEMVQREYLNFREEGTANFDANPGALELNVFKAYTLIVDQTTKSDNEGLVEAIKVANDDPDFRLYRMIWPYFAKQFEFSIGPDFIFESLKGMALLNFLSRSDKYEQDTTTFFEKMGKANGVDYIGRMLTMIHSNLMAPDKGMPDDHFIQFGQDSNDPWVQLLTVDPAVIAGNRKKQIDYVGMKERPMFKFGENRYIIPYWKYLYSSLYPGLVFTFHRNSNLHEREEFPEFKKWLGFEFSEKFLFRKVMDRCFGKRHVVRYYEDNFNPDCFIRRGRNVFVFEFKDNLVTADVIQSGSFDKFKAAIDRAFIETDNGKGMKAKGISQLDRLLTVLREKCEIGVISEDILPAGVNFAGLSIYPIIVYTNFYFDMPAVNDYLAVQFKKRFQQPKNVKPLTIVNLEYFLNRILTFADGLEEFHIELDAYQVHLAERKRKAEQTGEAEDQLASLPGFSEWVESNSTGYIHHRREELKNVLLELFEIV